MKHTKKLLIVFCLFSMYASYAGNGIRLIESPKQKQVYPRNLQTNLGTIVISGKAAIAAGYNAIAVKKYREYVFEQTFTQNLTSTTDSAAFSLTIPIKAELANYAVQIFAVRGNDYILIKEADSLLSGDAIIIQGQSNAVAGVYNGLANPENQSNYIRVWGSSGKPKNNAKKWFIGDGDVSQGEDGNTGQWGLRLAKRVMDVTGIPVVIFNGAKGGRAISWFQQTGNENNNYASLYRRVKESGFQQNIRAIFWFQGESDANPETTQEYYKESLYTLYNSWKRDYPGFQKLYVMQIKVSCYGPPESFAYIGEAQRQFANEIPEGALYATNGIAHYLDQCHYAYLTGYKKMGDQLYFQVIRDLSQDFTLKNVESPQVQEVIQSAPNQLTLIFKNQQDSYLWEAGSENDFVINNSTVKIINGTVKDASVILTMNKSEKIAELSFYGHMVGGSPCIRNISGLGMASFYKMPVNIVPAIAANNLHIYPVPANDKINAQYALEQGGKVIVTITDHSGRIMLESNQGLRNKGYNQLSLTIATLPKGVYFIQLQSVLNNYKGSFIKN